MAITFEQGLEGISPTAECLSYPYVEGASAKVALAEELAQDNFCAGGGSISQATTIVEAINKVISETNYYYQLATSKQAVLAEVISEMGNLKTLKTSIDPGTLQAAINLYNDNLELAQKMYFNQTLRDSANAYNNSGSSRYVLYVTINGSVNVKAGEFTSNGYKSYTINLGKDDKITNKTYDEISCSALSQTPTDIGSCDSANNQLMAELSKRGISYITIPTRPSN